MGLYLNEFNRRTEVMLMQVIELIAHSLEKSQSQYFINVAYFSIYFLSSCPFITFYWYLTRIQKSRNYEILPSVLSFVACLFCTYLPISIVYILIV